MEKLERIIIIRPAETIDDMIKAVSYAKQHGNLEGYDLKRIEQIMEKEKRANRALSEAFKRITLFEAAAYIAETFANELGDNVAKEMTPEIFRAQISLMSESDYSEAHETITRAYKGLLTKRSPLEVRGKVGGTYLLDLDQVLSLCSPGSYQTRMNTGFAGRRIRFSISGSGGYTFYQKEVDFNRDFAAFSEKWPCLFNPAVGRIILESPAPVDYAAQFLDRFAEQHQTIDPKEVRFSRGRSLEEQFRIDDHLDAQSFSYF